MEHDRGSELAKSIMLSSLGKGTENIISIYSVKIRDYINDMIKQNKTLSDLDLKELHSIFVKGNNDLGMHEYICTLMRTELGFFGALVPHNYGTSKIVYDEFIAEHHKIINGAGMDIAVKGPKGVGKTDYACLLGESNLIRNGVFAANIPMREQIEEFQESVYFVGYLSDLLRLRMKIPMNIHITVAIDEAEPVFKRILGATLESRNVIDFFWLTRKYNMSIISIWHYSDDIPAQIIDITKNGDGLFFDKKQKTIAFVDGESIKSVITEIPKTRLNFVSAGVGSAASFYIDINIKKLNQRTAGVTDDKEAKKLLMKALDDPSVYLKDYKHRVTNDDKDRSTFIKDIVKEINGTIDEFVTSTNRSIDWRKIRHVYDLGENDAKLIHNEILRSEEWRIWKKNFKERSENEK